MKSLIIYGDPRFDGYGGVEEHSENLIDNLSRINDLNLNVIKYGKLENKYDPVTYFELKRLPSNILIYPITFLIDLIRLQRLIKNINPDIIHYQGTHPLYSLGAILQNNSSLITVHGLMAVEMNYHKKNILMKFLIKKMEKYSLSKIRNIIVVAPEIEIIVKKMTNSHVFMIPNGVNLRPIMEINNSKINKKQVMFIGNFIKRKGIDVLIKAFSFLKEENYPVSLLIAGSGEEEQELKKMVKNLGITKDVEFLGFLKGDEKYCFLKSADIIVLPSYWESLPITVLEGMACKKPIIASNVGGIPYIVKDNINGFLVKPGNAHELADKLKILLENEKLREEMGKASLKMVENFEWNKIAEKTSNVYKEILKCGIL